MSSGRKPSAISGVAASSEVEIMTVYPSIAAYGIGRAFGSMYESIPLRIMGVKLSNLLFVLPTAPIAAGLYFLQKVTGHRYKLTNRSMQICHSLGNRKVKQVALTDITDVLIRELPGQQFYKAADLVLVGGKGNEEILTLPGIPYAHIFRQTILEARDSRQQVASSLATMNARPAIA
ncbi:MAG: hypothetical protein JWN70_3998 [Planctomycetaceae bacterium]|nr:hypothetical protein [Planctomycetaceae bacterium]